MESRLSQCQSDIKKELKDPDEERATGHGSKEQQTSIRKDGQCKSWTCCIVTIVCCWLMHCTLGFSYSFGNITPYLTSYLRNMTGDTELDYADTLWIQQTLDIVTNLLMWAAGLLFNRLPTKLCLLIGIIGMAASMFGTYWAIQHSFPATVAIYGILGGIPHALMYPAAINIAVRWVPERIGFITGLVLTGYGCGAFAWNQLITWYINPDNLQPDVTVREDVYYTQTKVLERVPPSFLLMGSVFVGIQLLALVLICEAPPETPKTTKIGFETGSEKQKLNSSLKDKETETSFIDANKSYGSTCESKIPESRDRPQYHPREVIKSRVFWSLWSIWFISQMGTAFVINLFKAYGQTFIFDDHFLTLVASFSSVFNAAGRPFWGIIGDRMGYRMVSLVCQCLVAGLVATFVTTEETGRAAFFVWVCAMFLCICGFFTMKAALMLSLFGSKYFNSNLGLLASNGVFGAVLTGIIAPVLKDAFGWHGMFYFGFGGVFTGFMLTLSLDIRCGKTIPQHMYADLSLRPRL